MAALGAGLAAFGAAGGKAVQAAAGDPLVLGQRNSAGERATEITSSGAPPTLVVTKPKEGVGLRGTALQAKGSLLVTDGHLVVGGRNAGIRVEAGPSSFPLLYAASHSRSNKNATARFEAREGAPALEAFTEGKNWFGTAIFARGALALYPSTGTALVGVGKTFTEVTLEKKMMDNSFLILATVQGASDRHVKYTERIDERRFRIALDAPAEETTRVGYLIVRGP
jgi:hypothetical protein